MSFDLPAFLRENEETFLDRWEERLARGGRAPAGGAESRRARHAQALRGVAATLEGKGAEALPFAAGMARIELRRPGGERNQADVVLDVLAGREVVRDELAARCSGATFTRAARELEAAFERVISLYGGTTCMLCQARQTESRARVERHLESVLESSQDALVLCDLDGVVEQWNPGAATLFGHAAEEMRGRSLGRVHPGGSFAPGAHEALLRDLLAHGHVRDPELRLVGRDGSDVWVDAGYTLVRDDRDRPLGIWILYRDVTGQRRVLDDRIHAERLALVGVMSAKFAHEIRNPLTSMLINLDLLRESLEAHAASQEDVETVAAVAAEVNRIQNVVKEYLRFSRKPQPAREPVALDDLLRRQLALLGPELEVHGVALELDLGAGSAIVDADEDQLWQAILNLVRNALEAMPRGGDLRVTTRASAAEVACTITDTGAGMSPEVQAEMFRPFFSTKPAGTGLGMPFVRQVVVEHAGTLECRSEPGRGTTMTIRLPAASLPGIEPAGHAGTTRGGAS